MAMALRPGRGRFRWLPGGACRRWHKDFDLAVVRPLGGAGRQLRARVGDHLIGRFCGGWDGGGSVGRFSGSESVITSLAGFAGGCRPQPPGGRKAIPAAFKYAAAVSRRTPVLRWIRRSDQPNRPNAMTCCFFSSVKTLLTSPRVSALGSELTSWMAVYRWPVFR